MGGVFLTYRTGDHDETVERLHADLDRHFGGGQVFLDRPSLLPGQRFRDTPRARMPDCDVLLAVLPPGWADVRDGSGARGVDDEDDRVRSGIEQALASGTVVVPVLLDGVTAPRPTDLPPSIRALAGHDARPLRRARWSADLADLIAVLEGEARPRWRPVPAPQERGRRPGRWLGVLTAALACATLVGVPALPQDDDWAGTDVLPYTLTAALLSTTLLCVPFLAVAAVFAVRLVRRSGDDLERELHAVRHRRTSIRHTWPLGLGIVLLGACGALRGDQGTAVVLPLLLVLGIAVAHATVTHLRLRRRDDDLWARWPHRLPDRVSRTELRRAAARLHVRLDRMTPPLSREQREKAAWELDDIAGAVRRVEREAARSRRGWLSGDHPWLFAGYVLWLALTAALLVASALAYIATGEGTVRRYVVLGVVALVGGALALGTLETAYRCRRRQRRELARQVTAFRDGLLRRVAELSPPPRPEPTAPALGPEEYAGPD
ncbi:MULTISPECIES: TIR domain-containing protein [unclassified Streptomyces]|uniref:TIR domain-containing protein n=1 Tax=unclassified Streptomyces TaxID=2593676 RepID=UPI0036EC9676